jgi:hypothetical protein
MIEYFPPLESDTGNELFWKLFEGHPRASRGELQLEPQPGLGIVPRDDVISSLTVL